MGIDARLRREELGCDVVRRGGNRKTAFLGRQKGTEIRLGLRGLTAHGEVGSEQQHRLPRKSLS